MAEYDIVDLGIMWDRVISIADEVVSALVTTSFSTMVRESADLSCVLFAATGSSLAQGRVSQPSFTGTAPQTLYHMLDKFPPQSLEPGDVLVTNDPWQGTGHLFDINVMRPVFRGERHVGFTMSVTHLPDIGGTGFTATTREVFEEGLNIPIMKLVKGGKMNDELMDLIRTNVRFEDMVVGDIMANITCNEVGGRLLLEFMDEYGLDDLTSLSSAIIGQTDAAMRARIRAIPDGTYRNEVPVEGVDEPIRLAAAVTISGDAVHIDFDGTTPALPHGINVPLCYTRAFSNYSIKCLTIPEVPNNEGALNPVSISAPPGCILNALKPSPTGGRHVIGHFVTPLIFGALAQALPNHVQADSGMQTQFHCLGRHRDGRDVSSLFMAAGGFGALQDFDGWAAKPCPANMRGTPIEIWEQATSTTILKKELVADSGGAGESRGGLAQNTVIRNDTGNPLNVACFGGRTEFAPEGYQGGRPGGLRRHLINGQEVHPKGRYTLNPGDQIEAVEAGGGGFGDPGRRAPDKLIEDVADGTVSPQGARRDYHAEVDLETGKVRRV